MRGGSDLLVSSGLELQSLQVGSTSDLLNLALLVCRGYEPG